MELLCNGMTLEISPGAFPLSTDSMVLSHFVHLPPKARVLDLGSGCATLGILLCAGNDLCRVTGLEIEESAHNQALKNIEANHLSHRLQSICRDLRLLPPEFTGQFDCCVSNPPYFTGGPASSRTPLARRDDNCSPDQLFTAAAQALKYGGDFFLVHKPERLAQLIALGAQASLEAKRLLLVRHRSDGPVSLICLQLRKGAKPGLKIEELSLRDADGTFTDSYRQIYHMQEG